MELYTKIDKQVDKYYEVVSINKSLSKKNFPLKVLVVLPFIFNVFMNIRQNIFSIQNHITFSSA